MGAGCWHVLASTKVTVCSWSSFYPHAFLLTLVTYSFEHSMYYVKLIKGGNEVTESNPNGHQMPERAFSSRFKGRLFPVGLHWH